MSNKPDPVDSLLRRTVLKASALTAGALAVSAPASAASDGDEETTESDADGEEGVVDEPDGFEVEILAEHAPFPDELAATFSHTFADTDHDDAGVPIGAHQVLDAESTMIVGEVHWAPGGTSGWHHHPGVVLVSTLEGAVEVTWERDCIPRTYSAGDGWFDPGVVHKADNVSDDELARAYVIFLGVPDGEPATIWVEPVEC